MVGKKDPLRDELLDITLEVMEKELKKHPNWEKATLKVRQWNGYVIYIERLPGEDPRHSEEYSLRVIHHQWY